MEFDNSFLLDILIRKITADVIQSLDSRVIKNTQDIITLEQHLNQQKHLIDQINMGLVQIESKSNSHHNHIETLQEQLRQNQSNQVAQHLQETNKINRIENSIDKIDIQITQLLGKLTDTQRFQENLKQTDISLQIQINYNDEINHNKWKEIEELSIKMQTDIQMEKQKLQAQICQLDAKIQLVDELAAQKQQLENGLITLEQQKNMMNQQFNDMLNDIVTREQYNKLQNEFRGIYDAEQKQLLQKHQILLAELLQLKQETSHSINQLKREGKSVDQQLIAYQQAAADHNTTFQIKLNQIDTFMKNFNECEYLKQQQWDFKYEQVLIAFDSFKNDFTTIKSNYKKTLIKQTDQLDKFMIDSRESTNMQLDNYFTQQKDKFIEYMNNKYVELKELIHQVQAEQQPKSQQSSGIPSKIQSVLQTQRLMQQSKETQVEDVQPDQYNQLKYELAQLQLEYVKISEKQIKTQERLEFAILQQRQQFRRLTDSQEVQKQNVEVNQQEQQYSSQQIQNIDNLLNNIEKCSASMIKLKSDYSNDIEGIQQQLLSIGKFKEQQRQYNKDMLQFNKMTNNILLLILIISLNNELVASHSDKYKISMQQLNYEYVSGQLDEMTHITYNGSRQQKVGLLVNCIRDNFKQCNIEQPLKTYSPARRIVKENKNKSVLVVKNQMNESNRLTSNRNMTVSRQQQQQSMRGNILKFSNTQRMDCQSDDDYHSSQINKRITFKLK